MLTRAGNANTRNMTKKLPPTSTQLPVYLPLASFYRYLACLVPACLLFASAATANPGNDAPPSLAGTYTVGPGGNYTTLTAAVADYNAASLSGPVVFSLIAGTYSGSETFP